MDLKGDEKLYTPLPWKGHIHGHCCFLVIANCVGYSAVIVTKQYHADIMLDLPCYFKVSAIHQPELVKYYFLSCLIGHAGLMIFIFI